MILVVEPTLVPKLGIVMPQDPPTLLIVVLVLPLLERLGVGRVLLLGVWRLVEGLDFRLGRVGCLGGVILLIVVLVMLKEECFFQNAKKKKKNFF